MGDVHDASYYAKCMVGGIFACGLTHAAVCPLDIVKCRRQVSLVSKRHDALCVWHTCFNRLQDILVLTKNFLFCLGKPSPLLQSR